MTEHFKSELYIILTLEPMILCYIISLQSFHPSHILCDFAGIDLRYSPHTALSNLTLEPSSKKRRRRRRREKHHVLRKEKRTKSDTRIHMADTDFLAISVP
jgi:hypothetical protein